MDTDVLEILHSLGYIPSNDDMFLCIESNLIEKAVKLVSMGYKCTDDTFIMCLTKDRYEMLDVLFAEAELTERSLITSMKTEGGHRYARWLLFSNKTALMEVYHIIMNWFDEDELKSALAFIKDTKLPIRDRVYLMLTYPGHYLLMMYPSIPALLCRIISCIINLIFSVMFNIFFFTPLKI
jgi:hypothetical protein